jgi:hypothetical protein
MSHFTVLVIGDKVAEQLAPYHEFECTGVNDQYVQDMDITKDIMAHMEKHNCDLDTALAYYGLANKIVLDENQINHEEDRYKYGYALFKKDGGNVLPHDASALIKAVKRTNPNAHWDWYTIGGRWTGFFRLKPGAKGEIGYPGVFTKAVKDKMMADSAKKGDIDFEAMRAKAGEEAGRDYDEFHKGVAGREWPDWEGMIAEAEKDGKEPDDDTIKQLRASYWSHPVVKDISAWAFSGTSSYRKTREEFVKAAEDNAFTTFAVVKDGKWYERGDMGWWGIVRNEKEGDQWDQEFNKLIDSVPDDTLLTLVDCHI